ncbi:MAG: molybdopterin-dependent oxidoreductase [Gammaproteobacteria bacterium]|nr:molybdopterin-dependent oxidoreductase [Gammaproteobacteria bacterium]
MDNLMLTKIDRRAFLRHTAAAAGTLSAGGLFLGLGNTASAKTDSAFAPNPFLHIAPNGDTTLWCGRCEMGQGVSTSLPSAVADELEADWSRVTILQGDGDPKYGPQATGGSRSINLMLEPMRQAGAAGREMLVAAAAATWGVPAAECEAKNHFIYHKASDRRLGYGELAATAAEQAVPETPKLKSREEFRYIGKSLQRHDQSAVVVGERVYGSDAVVPGMKYGAITHVPVLGGKVKRVDTSGLGDLADRVQVVTIDRLERPYGSLGGVGVVADNTWIAQQALSRLQIEWDRGPNAIYDTNTYKAELVERVEAPGASVYARGNVDEALEAAAVSHAATYVGGHLSHSPMEPMASCVDVGENHCEVWASTQDPVGIQETLAAFLGREKEDITVHVMAAGGAFGRKFMCDYVHEAAALSQAAGAPVQLTWSREEDTRTGFYHSCSAQHIAGSIDDEGNVSGWLHRAAFPTIASLFDPTNKGPGEGEMGDIIRQPLAIENFRAEVGEAPAHTRIGWWRAVYNIFFGFAINVFVDELARKAGKDPVDVFRKMYADYRGEDAERARRALAVLNKAAEMGGWGRAVPKGHGLGIAVHYSFSTYTAMMVHVEVDGDNIKVHRVDCAVDCGLVLTPDIATAQMEGAVIMGIGLALNTEIKFEDGAVVNSNFHDYPVARISNAPAEINVEFIGQENTSTGLGEPGVPTFAPALINAIYDASGKRHRSLPIRGIA